MSESAVVIAGAGPTGMMLAAELKLAGVESVLVERSRDGERAGSRAGGLQARTLEVLDQRGIVDRFLTEGQPVKQAGFAHVRLDLSDCPSRHNYTLALWQKHFERILAGWVDELGIAVRRGTEVTGFRQDDTGVAVELSGGEGLRAQYLVGCDGGRSTIRKAAGIPFPGWEPTVSHLIGEVEMTEQPELGVHFTARGIHSFGKEKYEIREGRVIYAEGGLVKVLVTEEAVGAKGEPTLRDLREALIAVCGTDYGACNPAWISRFTDAARQAETYRNGRVLLAGDAAHIHYPAGGQGLNLGVQDAVNLGWKLAQVVKGTSPESLLDSYQAERHPVAARVLHHSLAQVGLLRQDDRSKAAWAVAAEMLRMEEPRRRWAAEISGLGIHYDLGAGHPLLGRRMPDVELVTAGGKRRLFALLHGAQAVFLNLGRAGEFDIAPWAGRVQRVDAECRDRWELPAIGMVPQPGAVLIRPDGYAGWVGEPGDGAGLAEALVTWCGAPAADENYSTW